ncbi:hypothetical protein H2201_002201 [Coniosporium apollinis]|uniref:Uncharacterized protein n=1 Tax=Coniosporium apollinis TaxID=61459 RepID=A0ABQ9NZ66_9PEZI|nr:hypothetical protein H2201_002201 [Coniosporium apollinis]
MESRRRRSAVCYPSSRSPTPDPQTPPDRVVSLPVRSSKLIGSPIYCGTSASPVPTAVSGAQSDLRTRLTRLIALDRQLPPSGAIQAAGTDSHKGEEEDNREQAPSSHNTTHTSMDVDEGNSDEKALLGSSYHPHAVSSDHSEYVNTDSDEDSGTEMGEEMDEGGDTGMGKEGW